MLSRLLRPPLLSQTSQSIFRSPLPAALLERYSAGARTAARRQGQAKWNRSRKRSVRASFAAVRDDVITERRQPESGGPGPLQFPLLAPSADARTVYDQLSLSNFGATLQRRVRQHANPFRPDLQQMPPPVDWSEVYADPHRPLILDIGSASGRWLLAVARDSGLTGYNFMGLEIRAPLVDRAVCWTKELGIDDKVHFRLANATLVLERLLSTYPGRLELAAIQCPDPQFKARHHKRRIVQPNLVTAVASRLSSGGYVCLSSDVHEVAVHMRQEFETHAGSILRMAPEHNELSTFRDDADASESGAASDLKLVSEPSLAEQLPSDWATKGWLKDNIVGLPTERELSVLAKGLPMYRMLLVK